jgi:ABC-type xylose transport system permease subunit
VDTELLQRSPSRLQVRRSAVAFALEVAQRHSCCGLNTLNQMFGGVGLAICSFLMLASVSQQQNFDLLEGLAAGGQLAYALSLLLAWMQAPRRAPWKVPLCLVDLGALVFRLVILLQCSGSSPLPQTLWHTSMGQFLLGATLSVAVAGLGAAIEWWNLRSHQARRYAAIL